LFYPKEISLSLDLHAFLNFDFVAFYDTHVSTNGFASCLVIQVYLNWTRSCLLWLLPIVGLNIGQLLQLLLRVWLKYLLTNNVCLQPPLSSLTYWLHWQLWRALYYMLTLSPSRCITVTLRGVSLLGQSVLLMYSCKRTLQTFLQIFSLRRGLKLSTKL
jgi:hypothetical protein